MTRKEITDRIYELEKEIAELRKQLIEIDMQDFKDSDIDEEFKNIFDEWFRGIRQWRKSTNSRH